MKNNNNRLAAAAALAIGLSAAAHAGTTTIRFNDYDGGATADPSVGFTAFAGAGTTTGPQGFAGLGTGVNAFTGNFFRNAATGNPTEGSGGTFSNLPLGGRLSFQFLFASIDSWDTASDIYGPDYLELVVNGTVVFSALVTEFASRGAVLLGSGNLGFNPLYQDYAWDFSGVSALQNIAYGGTSATYRIRTAGAGWQGGDDESWAVDNFRVLLTAPDVTPIPVSGTLALSALALSLLALRRRTGG